MAAAPGALLSAVTDNRINEFVFKAVLHVLVYAYMELAAIVIERPGTELVYVTVVILQDLFHGPGVIGAGRLDHCKGQRLLISGLEQQLTDWCEKRNMSYHRKQSGK